MFFLFLLLAIAQAVVVTSAPFVIKNPTLVANTTYIFGTDIFLVNAGGIEEMTEVFELGLSTDFGGDSTKEITVFNSEYDVSSSGIMLQYLIFMRGSGASINVLTTSGTPDEDGHITVSSTPLAVQVFAYGIQGQPGASLSVVQFTSVAPDTCKIDEKALLIDFCEILENATVVDGVISNADTFCASCKAHLAQENTLTSFMDIFIPTYDFKTYLLDHYINASYSKSLYSDANITTMAANLDDWYTAVSDIRWFYNTTRCPETTLLQQLLFNKI
jgi:hypothetical protein